MCMTRWFRNEYIRKKISFEEADRIILKGMGTQFDDKLEKYYKQARSRFEEYYSSEGV